jgi:hypothetical protein
MSDSRQTLPIRTNHSRLRSTRHGENAVEGENRCSASSHLDPPRSSLRRSYPCTRPLAITRPILPAGSPVWLRLAAASRGTSATNASPPCRRTSSGWSKSWPRLRGGCAGKTADTEPRSGSRQATGPRTEPSNARPNTLLARSAEPHSGHLYLHCRADHPIMRAFRYHHADCGHGFPLPACRRFAKLRWPWLRPRPGLGSVTCGAARLLVAH